MKNKKMKNETTTKNKTLVNILCSVLAQVATIVSGLIIPRLLLSSFGSEANGLVASLTQFLNYISLLEGGLGSVVLTALYSPLAKKDDERLSLILAAANKFFRQIAVIFVAYTVLLGVVYPFIVESSFSRFYVFSLTVVMASSLFVQYFFSITYKLLLQADQRMYIVQLVQITTTILNTVAVAIALRVYPQLHVVKTLGVLIFAVQPLVFRLYVKKHYSIVRGIKADTSMIPQRWACFGQNFAFFIHDNTDTVVLSLFCGLKLVSVYSVYYLVVSHLKSFFRSFSHAYTPLIGKAIAVHNLQEANRVMDIYEFVVSAVGSIVFGSTIYLLPDFVLLYTKGVQDVNYYEPVFSTIIILAELVYCIRDPFVSVVYGAGEFKETAISAYIEAFINISLSIALVSKFGLLGVAIGTLTGMSFRLFYLMVYVSKRILYRPIGKSLKSVGITMTSITVSTFFAFCADKTGSETVLLWLKNGIMCATINCFVFFGMSMLLDREKAKIIVRHILRKD